MALSAHIGYDLQIKYEPFYVDCNPDEVKVRLPTRFNVNHLYHVSNKVLLVDPMGNIFEVAVEKIRGECFFAKGWGTLGKFYGLQLGGSARLVYVRSDMFMFKIRDRLDHEVIYPIPAKICYLDETPKPISWLGHHVVVNHFANLCQKPDFFHVLEKTLTYADVYSGRLDIPFDFCHIAFRQNNTRMILYDEYGLHTVCSLRFDTNTPEFCGFSDGWVQFCLVKGLAPGIRIQLAVPASNPNLVTFSIV